MKKLISLILVSIMAAAAFAVALPASAASGFFDVEDDRWSASSIRYAVKKEYMKGVGDGKFDPEGTLTRAMVATVLWRREGSPAPTAPSGFSDVPAGEWYADAVAWAKETGVVLGITETTFVPNRPITREQLATMLFRFSSSAPVSVPERADLEPFADDETVSGWAKEPLGWAVEAGLLKGTDGNRLAPDGFATREQFAAIIERYDGAFILEYNEPVLRSQYTEPDYPLVEDADFYVSTTGDDSADGSFAHPFKTWERARDAVRTLDRTDRDGIKVAFMAGEYGALDVTLSAEDAGDAGCPITYCKYGDGDVVFNNGVTLKKEDFEPLTEDEKALFPQKSTDLIMKYDLDEYFPSGMPDGLALFGNNGPIWEARYPNKYYDGSDHYLKNTFLLPEEYQREYCIEHETGWNYFGMDATILPPMTMILSKVDYFKDMKMTGYIMYGWRVDSLYIKNYDKETCAVTFDDTRLPSDFSTVGIRTPQMTLDLVFFENSPGFLDEQGEYWYDADTNNIYVYDPENEYNIGIGGSFLTLSGADNISVVGLTFKNSLSGSAVRVLNSEHVTLDSLNVYSVYRPVEASGSSDWFVVRGCDFSRFISNCISLGLTHHRTTLESNHAVIDNNFIHDYGLSKIFNNQAIADGAIGTVISHNIFKNSPNGAINLGMLSVIEYNVFTELMTSTQDFGVIYTWNAISSARKNTIRYNLFGSMGDMGGGAFGIYMDDFTQDQYIYGNLLWHSVIMLHNARDQYVFENAFIHSSLVTSGFGYFVDGKVQDGVLPDGTGWYAQFKRYYIDRVNVGEEGYEIWRETFPSLYALTPDVDNPYVYTSFFCPWDSVHNNGFIEKGYGIGEEVETYGEVYDNVTTAKDENPFFVNPTRGDYRLKDGVDFFDIPFEEMGRY